MDTYSSAKFVGNVVGNESTEETSSLKGRHNVANKVCKSSLVQVGKTVVAVLLLDTSIGYHEIRSHTP